MNSVGGVIQEEEIELTRESQETVSDPANWKRAIYRIPVPKKQKHTRRGLVRPRLSIPVILDLTESQNTPGMLVLETQRQNILSRLVPQRWT